MRRDYDFITEVLSKTIERQSGADARLRYGMDIRQQMLQAQQTGEPFEHYRVAWLQQSANLLLDLLQMVAKDFDGAHPGDKCSVLDLMDICVVTRNKLAMALATPNGAPKPQGT